MGRRLGSVTRCGVTSNAYRAHRDGVGSIGTFTTAGDAQRAVEATLGARRLRWTRSDLPADIEHYIANDGEWWPLDAPTGLEIWLDSDQGTETEIVGVDKRLVEWNSYDGSGDEQAEQANTAIAPTLVVDAGPSNLDVARFSATAAEYMTTTVVMSPPYTLSLVASYEAPGHGSEPKAVTAGNQTIQVNAGGNWEWSTNGGEVIGPLAVPGQLATLTVVHDGTAGEFFVDGTSYGSVADIELSQALVLSDAISYWGGDMMSLVVASRAYPAPLRRTLINYQKRRCLIS